MTEIRQYSVTAKMVALARFGQIPPRLFDLLFRTFGGLDELLTASKGQITAVEGVTSAMADRVQGASKKLAESERMVHELRAREITLHSRFDESFPARLFELNDPPLMLLVRGKLPKSGHKTIAVLGADDATSDGIEVTTKLARLMARANVQILSALSGGIGAAAHLAARSVDAPSYAVLESGFDSVSSPEETALAIDIASVGGIISEYFPEVKTAAENIAQANRLLVGMADGVIFTELYAGSQRALDALEFCDQTGKLTFFFIDPDVGGLSDEATLALAIDNGAIPMRGYEAIDDIIKSLV